MMIGELRNVQIGNGNHVKMIRFELSDHSSKVGKQAAIHSKRPVLFLEADIEIDRVGRDMICP